MNQYIKNRKGSISSLSSFRSLTNAVKREASEMIQRIADWRLERKIDRLSDAYIKALKSNQKGKARILWDQFIVAVKSRSPSQVARMQSRMRVKHYG